MDLSMDIHIHGKPAFRWAKAKAERLSLYLD